MNLAIDVASGEKPLEELVSGAISALQENKDINLILVGNEKNISKAISKTKYDHNRIDIRHTDEIIDMNESPANGIKHKKNASVLLAARLVREKEADGFFSPGNTGATLAAALTEIGRLKGVIRPPLISTLPKLNGEFCMLDMGANVDCTTDYIVQFAVMGRVFAKRYLKIDNPRVGLLNIGEEDSKGNANTKKSFERLQKMKKINFIGNIEPNDMLKSDSVDVVVADGFDGNIVLKTIEGTASFVVNLLKEEVKKNPVSVMGGLMMKPVFNNLKSKMSSDSYGSAILLGLNGGAFVGHGKTSGVGMKNAVLNMYKFLDAKINEKIAKELYDSGAKRRIF
ncbi:phosphate acyltransferase PlsX [Brachyspira hyodysenteriae]|uniref:phosphate acyltransferase PlsX n=1 Tax=Brachyspira hyodysenteriae TaxID=159 RepID=UPI00118271A2|nr:phosphate acyltransferase PlsX [Brachyspira hyodysenteriae]TVL67206.1 phosphate acyltransferase PlsX [Brachyspira hyodysenteriae]TVL77527.1 phosphate acyltransferase PlsX [Brachyspira hyodysenteriae]